MAIGRPISLTPNIATKAINSVATANQTDFTVTGGYRINELAVYRNGVRLAQGRDFTANDGSSVTLTNGATVNDIIEFVIFDAFNVANTIVSAASSQTLSGDLNVTGKLYGGTVDTDSLNIGVGTFVSAVHVGTAITIDAAGNTNTTGIVTAASFSGDGTNITGVVGVGTLNVRTNTLTVSGVSTFTGALNATSVVSSGAVSGTTGTFSGAVNVDATTDSTSSSTGALIVDGGLGVAKNVFIGAGLSVAGTLTYEDVTNVDSVGLITAKSGVNVTGGQIQVGAAFSVGPAGVVTATSYYGDGSNLSNITSTTINSNADNRLITGSGTANTLNGETNLTFDGGSFKVGSGITMSATAGVTTYSNVGGGISFRDVAKLYMGNDGGLQFYREGLNTFLQNIPSGGDLMIQSTDAIRIGSLTADKIRINPTSGNNSIVINDAAGNSRLVVKNSGFDISAGITTVANNHEFKFGSHSSGAGVTFATTSGIVTFADGSATANSLHFGSAGDLKIYHSGSSSWIYENGTGPLYLGTNNSNIEINGGGSANDTMAKFKSTEGVELYYNATKKFETTNDGVSITGICTATDFSGASGGAADFPNALTSTTVTTSSNILIAADAYLKIGTGEDLQLSHNGSNSYIDNSTGHLYIRSNTGIDLTNLAGNKTMIEGTNAGSVALYYDNSKKFETSNDGTVTTGIATFTAGANFDGILSEKYNETAGKLSDNNNIDLEDGMIHFFTTTESTTSSPNIRYNSSKSLNNMMSVGDAITVTIITSPASGAYSADLNIDGNGVTEEWLGGSAPSAGGSGGYDVYSYTILKRGSASFTVLANVQNYA